MPAGKDDYDNGWERRPVVALLFISFPFFVNFYQNKHMQLASVFIFIPACSQQEANPQILNKASLVSKMLK